MEIFNKYISQIKKFSLSEITEHSNRKDLQELLELISTEKNKKIKILHEPKRNKGLSPDFKISINESIIGYVENKGIEEDLNKILKSEQIKKYKELSDNILVTNYIDWVWVRDKKQKIISLCSLEDLEKRHFKLDETNVNEVYNLILNFFSQPSLGISKPKDLASALAIRGKLLNEFLQKELHRQEKENSTGKLFGLYDTFKINIHTELSLDNFADAFSQTLIYGLFLSKLNSANSNKTELITLYNAKKFIPVSFELIKELLDFIDELDREEYIEVKWIVEEVLSILNNLNLNDILSGLSYKKWRKKSTDVQDLKDPYIYFYEDFLSAYDKKLRKAKGVYYTPPQVVNFIIRAIDDILTEKFNINDGLANREQVTVLDFATGTGTFLLEIFKNIFDKLPEHSGKRNLIIKEHILKNLFGFEFLIAPYTIAHLKLSQFLIDNGYNFEKNERLQVYLTNTLELISPQYNAFIPALAEETKLAKDVKEKPILVITGNPPYSGHSQNPSWRFETKILKNKQVNKKVFTWIGSQIEKYKFVDGKPLGEKNPKWLQDDYVKFIRFAQFKMEQVEEGVVGIITNHSFLDNPTFRGMRQSLMNTFDEMYFLDLHGNAKKREKTPDGGKDENVFDIEQGVCISIMIKYKSNKQNGENKCDLFHSDFWGLRDEKYTNCLINKIADIKWENIKPDSPYYLFTVHSTKSIKQYNSFFSLKNIFKLHSIGVVTANDNLFIDFEKNKLISKIKNIYRNADEFLITKTSYRPFDIRYIYYDKSKIERAREKVMINFQENNIGIIAKRQTTYPDRNYFFTSNKIVSDGFFAADNKGRDTTFPLYIIKNEVEHTFFGVGEPNVPYKIENFTNDFRKYIDNLYQYHFLPEQILGYIYGVFYSPEYRKKYSEFLKIDFPRIPFSDDKKIFEKLSSLGWELIQTHLMNEEYLSKLPKNNPGNYTGAGNNEVIRIEYIFDAKTKKNRLKINSEQYFDNIPKNIYNFYIGGYQVLDKYLKDRKGRTLTLNEIENVENIIKIISFTISQMSKINTLTKEWI